MPSRSYWRSVCGCMSASSAATEMTKIGWSNSMSMTGLLQPCLGCQAGPDVLAGGGRGEGLHGFLGVLAELLRHGDVDGDQQVPGGFAVLDAAAFDPERPAGGGAGGDPDPDLVAVDGRNLDVGAQGRLREGDRDVDAQVVAVAGVEIMGFHGDRDHEVAVAGRAVLALAAHPDLLAVLDAGRDPHVDDLAVRFAQADGGAADGAGEGDAGGRGPVRALLRAALERLATAAETAAAKQVGELGRDAPGGAVPAGVPAAAAGEKAAEQVLEASAAAGLPGTAGSEPGAAAHRADGVVLLPLIGIREHRVRLGDVLKLLLGSGIPGVGVRMMLPRELPVGLLNVGVGSVLGDTKDLVEVLVDPV